MEENMQKNNRKSLLVITAVLCLLVVRPGDCSDQNQFVAENSTSEALNNSALQDKRIKNNELTDTHWPTSQTNQRFHEEKDAGNSNGSSTAIYKRYEYRNLDDRIDCHGVKEDGTKELVGTYNCTTDYCGFYDAGAHHYSGNDRPTAMLTEYGGTPAPFLFNFKENKKISPDYQSFRDISSNGNRNTEYLIVRLDNKEGIIDTYGNVVIPPIYSLLGEYATNGPAIDYSLKYNIITARQNGRAGVVEISTGKVLIPFNYDAATIFRDSGNVVLEESGKWYIFDLNGRKVLESGFDHVQLIDNLAIVVNDDKLDIIDSKGAKLNSESITTFMDHDKFNCCGSPIGIYLHKNERNPDAIMIHLDKWVNSDNDDYETYEYSFDITNGNIVFVKATDRYGKIIAGNGN